MQDLFYLFKPSRRFPARQTGGKFLGSNSEVPRKTGSLGYFFEIAIQKGARGYDSNSSQYLPARNTRRLCFGRTLRGRDDCPARHRTRSIPERRSRKKEERRA